MSSLSDCQRAGALDRAHPVPTCQAATRRPIMGAKRVPKLNAWMVKTRVCGTCRFLRLHRVPALIARTPQPPPDTTPSSPQRHALLAAAATSPPSPPSPHSSRRKTGQRPHFDPPRSFQMVSSAGILALVAALLLVLRGDDVSAQGAARVAPRASSARVAPAAPPLTAEHRPNTELRPNTTQGAFRAAHAKRCRPVAFADCLPPTLRLAPGGTG